MRTVAHLLVILVAFMLGQLASAQIVSGNNPDFVPTQQSPMGFPTDYGYQNNVVARWVTPQFETITQPTKMGLMAYHFSDIAKVEFFLNGGPAYTVYSKTLHENLNAYWITVGPLPDAEKNNLTAIVYPNSGTPFIMGRGTIRDNPTTVVQDTLRNATWTFKQYGVEPLQFASDFNNTLRKVNMYCAPWGNDSNPGTEALPKKTLFPALQASRDAQGNIDGVTIYLYEGDYAWASQYYIGGYGNRYRYLTVKNHPGNTVSARIAYPDPGPYGAGFRTNKVKIEGLKIQHAGGPNYQSLITTSSAPSGYWEVGQALYLKNCIVDNYQAWFNQNVGPVGTGWNYVAQVDCINSNLWNAIGGSLNVRVHFENIESDLFAKGSSVFDCTFKMHGNVGWTVNGTDSGAHPDTIQWFSGFEPNVTSGTSNTILYKFRPLDRFEPAWSQIVFGQGAVDVVIDDFVVQTGRIGNYDANSSWGRGISITESYNVMIRNSNIAGSWLGISKFPGMGPDTALLQNVKRIGWNYITQNPVDLTSMIDGKYGLLWQTDAEWIAAGKPNDYSTVGTDYDVTGGFGGISEPRLGPVGVRYQFNWTDPDIHYNAKSLGNVLSNWGGIGVGAPGDYNKDGWVNAEDLSFIFSKWN
jgi:hypothetical protein